MEAEKEYYKVIPFAEDYAVSNLGNIKRLDIDRVLKQSISHCGYKRIGLTINKKRKYFSVHRLVASVFMLNPLNYEQVNHIDGVKTNNHLFNLEWCNRSENMQHAIKIGLWDNKGNKHPMCKLTEENVREIKKLLAQKISHRTLAKQFGIGKTAIGNISKGLKWKHITI